MNLSAGTKLGPYEIVAPLGAGGMGEVYRARDTRLDRTVAIKILPPQFSSDPVRKQRFEREAKTISSLNHPNICVLYDVGHQDGMDYLVLECVEGETLAKRLEKGPLSLEQAIKFGMHIADALHKAHRSGVVHRDLKPGNIMLTSAGAKLLDFGLAKPSVALASGATLTADQGAPVTEEGTIVGTFQYMSPEQVEGKEVDGRSDIFSLGAVVYEMVTGRRAFEGKSQLSVASAILEKDPEPISAVKPMTPPALEHAVKKCLAKLPDERWQSASDLASELNWISESGSQAGIPAPAMLKWKPRERLAWAIAIAGLLTAALAGVVGGLFLVTRHNEPEARYTRVTYRKGSLQAARFSRDGQTIVYSGEWEDEPPQVTIARLGSPESRPLGIPPGAIAAVSSLDELAVLQACEFVYLNNCVGTLATVSLAGGSPRDLAEHVAYADWAPGGNQLAISIYSSDGARLEFPPGHVLYQQKTGWFGHLRFSPDGNLIAYENHPFSHDDEGSIEVVNLSGKRTVLSNGSLSLEGLAWSPDGKEVWFAGASHSGWANSVRAVTLSGKERAVLSLPSGVRLHDIARDGRVLLSRESWRTQLKALFPGDAHEHAYSWLDNPGITAISSDGRAITFYEAGDIYYIERDSLAYYRRTDGSAAVRLGRGRAALSPDGKWVLQFSEKDRKLALQPVGPGEPKELPTSDLVGFYHLVWSDNGEQITYEAVTSRNEWNIYTQRVQGGSPILIKALGRNAFPILAPDGRMLAIREERGGISLYPTDGGHPVVVKGVLDSEYPIRFANGGRSLLVADPTRHELVLTLVDMTSGHREPWKRFTAELDIGTSSQIFLVTPDLKYYMYQSPQYLSDLYMADNLR